MAEYGEWDSGYSKQQSTRPQTLGYGLVDSPAGQAAWILEKFWTWTDCNGHPENVLTRDELLDNVMLYWLPGHGRVVGAAVLGELPRAVASARRRSPCPTGCSIFPKEIFRSSRRWAEKRFTNLVHWNELERGGHFAAFEQPETFVNELRTCFRQHAERRDEQRAAEQREFAEYARRWLAENAPPPPPERLPVLPIEVGAGPLCDYLRDWQRTLLRRRPRRRRHPEGVRRRRAPGLPAHREPRDEPARGTPYMLNVVALSMAIPTILVHGTEEQKRRFIPPALRCDEIWCQGFSEPGAGSDLANAADERRAATGDDWIVNGHKVWTSLGHIAQWMILLARTSKEHKYDGLTYFLCPIEGHPGVTVKPLIKMTGDSGFNEVFFENVEIPDSLRLDAVGKGWTVAMTTLTYERGAAEGAGGGGGDRASAIERLIALARES